MLAGLGDELAVPVEMRISYAADGPCPGGGGTCARLELAASGTARKENKTIAIRGTGQVHHDLARGAVSDGSLRVERHLRDAPHDEGIFYDYHLRPSAPLAATH